MAADFDFGFEVFADEEEEEAGWSDYDFYMMDRKSWSVDIGSQLIGVYDGRWPLTEKLLWV